MYISKIKIENYKGFNNHDEIELKKGINLIIGKNNSGKTAFLEALTLKVSVPHKNTIKNKKKTSIIEAEIVIQKAEIIRYVNSEEYDNKPFDWPNVIFKRIFESKLNNSNKPQFQSISRGNIDTIMKADNRESSTFSHSTDIINVQKEVDKYFNKLILANFRLYEGAALIEKSYSDDYFKFQINDRDEIEIIKQTPNNISRGFVNNLFSYHVGNIYKFDIHRKVEAKSPTSNNSKLHTNCGNLSSVVDNLQGDTKLFNEYKKMVKYVFSEIKDISIQKAEEQKAEVRIWNIEPISRRTDLAISLDDCGTGVGQVLAILYVVISATEPKVILIDEPNSFLHPSASRKLMEILTEYPQHQYFITTHSPELISNFGDNILRTELINGEIQVKQIDKKDKLQIQEIFEDVGVRLSDVYGYDSVFWVEGETEEKCLPLILKKHNIDISNIAFSSVRDTGGTGKFDKDYIKNTVKIYKKLSLLENTYIPPAIGFFFDNEGKNIHDIVSNINTDDRHKVIFTEKMLYENYLLSEDAIFKLLEQEQVKLLEIEPKTIFAFQKNDISTWLENNKSDKKYWNEKVPTPIQLEDWKDKIHAAKLLEDLFKHFFKNLNNYRKTKHSVDLTKILLEQNTTIFDEFIKKINKIMK